MCEIAILHPQRFDVDEMLEAAKTLYEAMTSSLGLVFIEDINGTFQYQVYKSIKPHYPDVREFIENYHDNAARLIIHGRLATHGEVTVQNAHPIKIDCSTCNIDYVLHNGIIHDHERYRDESEHDYGTIVDSEAIVHMHEDVPPNFDDTRNDLFGSEPAYILLNTERAYIYTSGRYTLSKHGEMGLRHRGFTPTEDISYTEVILTPASEAN